MTVAPIVSTVEVKAGPARAFALFTERMGDWWPKGMTVGRNPHTAVVVEPRTGGRWFERDASGTECDWGKVLAWDPPTRLLLGWQLDSRFQHDPNLVTEVELSFEALESGGTRLRLEHRNLERFGADAEKISGQLGGGWPTLMGHYRDLADAA